MENLLAVSLVLCHVTILNVMFAIKLKLSNYTNINFIWELIMKLSFDNAECECKFWFCDKISETFSIISALHELTK